MKASCGPFMYGQLAVQDNIYCTHLRSTHLVTRIGVSEEVLQQVPGQITWWLYGVILCPSGKARAVTRVFVVAVRCCCHAQLCGLRKACLTYGGACCWALFVIVVEMRSYDAHGVSGSSGDIPRSVTWLAGQKTLLLFVIVLLCWA